MICLALDTSTEACSAALWRDGELFQRYELAPRRHAELVLPMIDAVLHEAGVDVRDCQALAFGRGPGAFTGLRIAAGVAQGIAFSVGLPVAPVSTLAALALAAARERGTGRVHVAAAIDARIGEVYWGLYRVTDPAGADGGDPDAGDAGVRLLAPEQVIAPDAPDLALPDADPAVDWIGVGSGWRGGGQESASGHGPTLARRLAVRGLLPDRYPRAAEIAILGAGLARAGRTVSAEQALPVYLRDRVAVAKP